MNVRFVAPLVSALCLAALSSHAETRKPARPRAPQSHVALTKKPNLVVTSVDRPKRDYEAETYSGVALDDAYARDRGLDKGLVRMVFEKQSRATFRVPHERIKKLVAFVVADDASQARLATGRPPLLTVGTSSPGLATDRVDVLDTDAGVIAIETITLNAGIFTTSDVYVFQKGASLEQRIGALKDVPLVLRERITEALTLAERASVRSQ